MEQILTIAMPFVGTALGAAMVFFMKKKMNAKLLRQRLEAEGDTLTEEERAIIEAYLGIV